MVQCHQIDQLKLHGSDIQTLDKQGKQLSARLRSSNLTEYQQEEYKYPQLQQIAQTNIKTDKYKSSVINKYPKGQQVKVLLLNTDQLLGKTSDQEQQMKGILKHLESKQQFEGLIQQRGSKSFQKLIDRKDSESQKKKSTKISMRRKEMDEQQSIFHMQKFLQDLKQNK
eukprot:403347548